MTSDYQRGLLDAAKVAREHCNRHEGLFSMMEAGREIAHEILALPVEPNAGETPVEVLASKLIDAWCAEHGGRISLEKEIQIIAIVTKQADEERERLLNMAFNHGSCEMCGRSDTALERQRNAASAHEIPLCGDHARSWFTERNYLVDGMGAKCVVCAHADNTAIKKGPA